MAPTFDPNNSQPDYGVHDESMMIDDVDGNSSPAASHHTDDEYATPPNRKIPLEDIEAMMSIHEQMADEQMADEQTAATHSQDPTHLWAEGDTDQFPPQATLADISAALALDDPSRLFDDEPRDGDDGDDVVTSNDPPAETSDIGHDESEPDGDYEPSDLGAVDNEQEYEYDEEPKDDDHEPSDFGDQDGEGEEEEDPDAAGDTDTEEPAYSQHGGGKRDILDPNDILDEGVKRTIKLTPRATRTTQASAAQRDPTGKIPALRLDQDGEDLMSPPPSPSPQRRRRSPSLEPLEHGDVHWSDGSNGPVISLHINNTAEDEPEHDIFKIPIADIREKPGSGLLAVSRYLLDHVAGKASTPAEYGIILPKRSTPYKTADEIDDDREAEEAEEYDINQLSPRRPGRHLTQTLDMVDCGIGLLDPIRRSLADLAGVSENFIQARWDKRKGGSGKGLGQARWRAWVRYYHTKPSIIMDRTEVTLQEGEEKWHNSVASRCYERFKELFPDTHTDIIDNLTALAELERQPQTVHQRGQQWDEYRRDLIELMQRGHEMGFESYVVAGGSNIHQDKGLGFVHETQFAEGFLVQKTRSKNNDHLGHFISYVQNKVSDAILEDEDNAEPAKPSKDTKPSKSTKPSRATKPSKDTKPSTSKNPPSVISVSSEHAEPDDGLAKTGGRYHQARYALSAAAAPVGLVLNVNQFPWGTLPTALNKAGVRIVNFPLGVIFPGHEKEKNRGITAASAAHIDLILERLSPKATQQIRFEIIPADIPKSKKRPVIINAAPQPLSKIERGSRLLADGTIDVKGPWRLKPGDHEVTPDFVESVDEDGPSKARTRVRKRKERTPPDVPPDVPDRSEDERRVLRSERKGKGKARAKAPAASAETAISISEDDSRGVQVKRLRHKESSPDTAVDVQNPQGGLKRPVSGSGVWTPFKKARSVVEVVIPTPSRNSGSVPDATSTPRPLAKAASASKSKDAPSKDAATPRPTDKAASASKSKDVPSKDATSSSKTAVASGSKSKDVPSKDATSSSKTAVAAVPVPKKAPKPSAPSEAASSSSKGAVAAVPASAGVPKKASKAAAPSEVASSSKAPVATVSSSKSAVAAVPAPAGVPKNASEVAAPLAPHPTIEATITPEARPKAAPLASNSGTSKDEAKAQRPSASKGDTEGDVVPSKGSTADAVSKDVTLKGEAKLKSRRPSSKGNTKGDAVPSEGSAADARYKDSRRSSASKSDMKDNAVLKAARGPSTSKASTTALGVTSAPSAEPSAEVIDDTRPRSPVSTTPVLATPAAHVHDHTHDQPLLMHEGAGAGETPTIRALPRRLPPSTSLGGLDDVPPYEGLPRRTTLPVDPRATLQVGGHGRVSNHPSGELSSNQAEVHQAQSRDRLGYPYGITDARLEASEPQDYGYYRREHDYRRGYYPHPGRSIGGSHAGMGERSADGREHPRGPSYESRNYFDYPRSRVPSDYHSRSRDHSHDSLVEHERANEHADEPHRRPYPPHSREHSHEPLGGPLGRAFELHDNEPNRRPRVPFSRDHPPDDYVRMREYYPQDRRPSRDYRDYYDRYEHPRYPSDYNFDPRDPGFHEPAYYPRNDYRDTRRPEGYRTHLHPPSPSRGRSPGTAFAAAPEGSGGRSPGVTPAGVPPATEATEP